MQAAAGSQRGYMQRGSPGADPGPPPAMRPSSPSPAMQPRSAAPSTRPPQTGGARRSTRAGSGGSSASLLLSQIEKSVTHLLVATKQLLETLTQWSWGQATDTQVSDVYVRLGYEFNMACRAFTAINVDTSDLGNVPDMLRHILEATLSQEAGAENLERYLPRIRDIIINLLHGLKRKQQRLRQKQQGGSREGTPLPERTSSVSTAGSTTSGLTNMLEEGLENNYRPDSQRAESQPMNTYPSPTHRFHVQRERSRGSLSSEHSSLSSNTMQSIPVVPPYAKNEANEPSTTTSADPSIDAFPPPPPPPPPPDKQSSALAALQKGGDLERRASRRYSQYQISKHLGGASNAVPIFSSQNTPIPNRGRREARESLRALQSRDSARNSQVLPSHVRQSGSDSPSVASPNRLSEVSPDDPSNTPPYKAGKWNHWKNESDVVPPFAPNGILVEADVTQKSQVLPSGPATERSEPAEASDTHHTPAGKVEQKGVESYNPSPSPSPSKDLTLFLQYRSKVKKIVLPEGRDELSIGRLQLAFIEKFSWNTQQNGADLPEIYIQDPVSGVRHELEDLSDVNDRTVLVLNVEPLEEVKKHIDDGMLSLTKIVKEVKQHVHDHGATIQRVSDRQQETAKELARLSTGQTATRSTTELSKPSSSPGRNLNVGQVGELRDLKRDLAILRQTYSNFQSAVQNSMSEIRSNAAKVKTAAAKASVPELAGDAGYNYVTVGRKQLNSDSDRLVGKVDDLQDMIEDLRKDVVHRGVRPLPRQLEEAAKDITGLTKELKRMEDYMKQEKPIWTKIWERELEEVCQGRDELRVMEDLLVDLRDDLEKAGETFTLVEQATKEQMKDNGTGASAGTARQFARGLNNLGNSLDQNAAKEDVLGEVRALQPNHEDRLEAIERAEKLRQKELESRRGNALQREIASFVEGKLKKSGGFEEVERARRAMDDKIRREVWERQNGIIADEVDDDELLQDGEEAEDGDEGDGEEAEGQPGDAEDGQTSKAEGASPTAAAATDGS